MTSATPCIFCQIISGSAPANIVHRDDLCTCFMDIQPVNPGHVLIVPNEHAAYLADMPVETGAQMFRLAHRLVAALRQADLKAEGVNLFLADGEAAMQEVFHVHLHVFPRHRGDGFGLKFGDHYFQKPSREALERVAAELRSVLTRA